MRGLITPKNKINISTNQKILPANIVNKNTMLIRPIIEINNKNKKEKNSLFDSINNINEKLDKKNDYFEALKDQIFSPSGFEFSKSESKNQKIFSELSNKLNIMKNNININPFQSDIKKLTNNNNTQIKYSPEKSYVLSKRKTLFLDLDETLVHSNFKTFYSKEDIVFDMLYDGKKHTIHVLKRPYVDEFLDKVSNLFELVIFTASISDYANPLLNKLDPNRRISYRLFREHCTSSGNLFIKDLRKVGRNLKDVIIIDNNPISYLYNKDNGIPISTWHSFQNDKELIKLIPLLELLSKCDDVRTIIKKVVNGNYVNFHEVNKLLNPRNNNDKNEYRKKKENVKENKDFFSFNSTLQSNRLDKSLNNYYYNNNLLKFNHRFTNYYFDPNEKNSVRENLNELEPRKSNNLFDDKVYLEKYNTFYNPKTASIMEKKFGETFTKSIFDKNKNEDNNLLSNGYITSSSKSLSVKKISSKNFFNKLIEIKDKNKEENEKLEFFHIRSTNLINKDFDLNSMTLPSKSVEKNNFFSFHQSKFNEPKVNHFNSKISSINLQERNENKLNMERNKTFDSLSFLSSNNNKTIRNNSSLFNDGFKSINGNYTLKSNFFN